MRLQIGPELDPVIRDSTRLAKPQFIDSHPGTAPHTASPARHAAAPIDASHHVSHCESNCTTTTESASTIAFTLASQQQQQQQSTRRTEAPLATAPNTTSTRHRVGIPTEDRCIHMQRITSLIRLQTRTSIRFRSSTML